MDLPPDYDTSDIFFPKPPRYSVLSDNDIEESLANGSVVIEPFNKDNLSTSSYDVTLGSSFYRETKSRKSLVAERRKKIVRTYNPYSESEVKRVWGSPHKASTQKDTFTQASAPFENIGPDDLIIMIAPGETILAHTNEFIGGRDYVTTMMKARSSMGRNFIEVCKCAGWGDVGYTNRWTMEITNNSQYYHIPLVVGRRIAQIVFLPTGPIKSKNAQYESSGKYQQGECLEELMAKWEPSCMLPKMYLDREINSQVSSSSSLASPSPTAKK